MVEKNQIRENLIKRYEAKHAGSRAYYEKACSCLPGADTRSAAYFAPFPFVTEKAQGCRMVDIDGNEYYDFLNNYTSLAHGHAFAPVVKAVQEQAEKGTAFATNLELQYNLAKLLCGRVSCLDEIRFANSASEAMMFAMRAARAFTGKDGFLTINGGYSGSTDFLQANYPPDLEHGKSPQPKAGRGISGSIVKDIYVAPFNDLNRMEEILKQNNEKIAAILMEPMMGSSGCIMPEPGYLEGVRRLADKYEVLLIFDETITLRFSEGGLGEIYGVKPDLLVTGKTIGGGLPVGAFGGAKVIMEQFNPAQEDCISHTGTFNGNSITMAAGLAAMQYFTQTEIDRINGLGDRMKKGILDIFSSLNINGCVQGFGSILQINHHSLVSAKNAEEFYISEKLDGLLCSCIHLSMVTKGVFFAPRGMIVLSTAMNEQVIDEALYAFREAYEEIRSLLP